jgi:hypothetical protein
VTTLAGADWENPSGIDFSRRHIRSTLPRSRGWCGNGVPDRQQRQDSAKVTLTGEISAGRVERAGLVTANGRCRGCRRKRQQFTTVTAYRRCLLFWVRGRFECRGWRRRARFRGAASLLMVRAGFLLTLVTMHPPDRAQAPVSESPGGGSGESCWNLCPAGSAARDLSAGCSTHS